MSALPRASFVGTGPVGRALAGAYAAGGGAVHAVLSRDRTKAEVVAAECGGRGTSAPADLAGSDVVVVCVPDRAIADVGAAVAAATRGRTPLLLHTSGVLPGAELVARPREPGPAAGSRTGSLHPLQSFPAALAAGAGSAELVRRVAGVHWFHEGEGGDVAQVLVAVWRGVFHALAPGGKALYHAAAVIVSNHAVALFADATRLLAVAGVAPAESQPALAALLGGTLANLRAVGVPHALTGPVARGDVATVARHAAVLRALDPGVFEAYRAMARRAVVVARESRAIDAATAEAIEAALAAN